MKKIVLLLLLLIFTACTPNYTKHEASVIVFKTPTLSFADAGFIHDNEKEIKVVILVAGQALFTLELGRKICMNGSCLSKEKFVHKNLSIYYPKDILQEIFLGKPIFEAQNKQKLADGFEQRLVDPGKYDIHYRVQNGQIRFKDSISKVLIKTKKILQEEKEDE